MDEFATAEEPAEEPAVPAGDLEPTAVQKRLLSSVKEEFAARFAHCSADYTTALTWFSKSLSSALFMFFATLFSTVALGAHLQLATDNRIGLSEYLAMNSAAG
eukprot:3868303-Prymnesium_polylepis.1